MNRSLWGAAVAGVTLGGSAVHLVPSAWWLAATAVAVGAISVAMVAGAVAGHLHGRCRAR